MNEFLKKIAGILEVDDLKETDELKAFPQWDSLSVLSVIAMVDASYNVNLHATDFNAIKNAGDLWSLVQSKRSS
jgi:acyl carrier protein